MSYQVLARKWRPRKFGEMVGQEHVLRALINALDSNRIHHAFLFTGTRGVGKTTIARILAKSLNCEQGVSSQPCGECSSCQEIDEGRFIDLIEVDAASRTKVEDTRDLLDNVQYAPTRGRYKVYLIDEVHMLSNHSFNALLKTLEEPPPHVKFLLATTDPQKLPVTVLSRCLQFNLRRLMPDRIQDYLAHLLTEEGISSEPAALQHLARAADGSMRDALSLLDQAIAYGGGQVNEGNVRAMLGSIEQGHVYSLLEAVASGDGSLVIQTLEDLSAQAPDYSEVLAELITLLHRVALLQQVPEAHDDSMGDGEKLKTLAQNLTPEDVQLYYQIGITGRRDLPLAPDPRMGLEMILLRMLAFRPVSPIKASAIKMKPDKSILAQTNAVNKDQRTAPASKPVSEPAKMDAPKPQVTPAPVSVEAPVDSSVTDTGSNEESDEWHRTINTLGLTGVVQQLAAHCAIVQQDAGVLKLALEPAHAPLLTKEREQRLQQALAEHFGTPIKLTIEVQSLQGDTPAARDARQQAQRQAEAVATIEGDANVKNILDTFGAQIDLQTVQPVD